MAFQGNSNKTAAVHVNGPSVRKEGAKPFAGKPPVIHPGMANRTDTSIGAPPAGAPPDASSPLPTDPTRQGKEFPIPKASWGMKGGDGQGTDEHMAHRVMDAATKAPDDFAKSLHTKLPQSTSED